MDLFAHTDVAYLIADSILRVNRTVTAFDQAEDAGTPSKPSMGSVSV